MSEAREAILGRIRAAVAHAPAAEPSRERSYRLGLGLDTVELVALFAERIADYDVIVRETTSDRLAAALTEVCAEHGVHRLAVPLDLPDAWQPDGVELVRDGGLASAELDALDGALTGCLLAIAETGTVVLDCGPGQGRRALTLVPDLHICVVFAGEIVGTVPEAFERITVERPVTFVSGPSATSDIELSRVRGVHGPRRLDVVIVRGQP
jgi:L-lactate dehydrogenase complex protein LldG